MKFIIKKPFISLLFFVLGVLIAGGGTFVYATWDEAKTGGSGYLSESNWNALVGMLENGAGSGGGPGAGPVR